MASEHTPDGTKAAADPGGRFRLGAQVEERQGEGQRVDHLPYAPVSPADNEGNAWRRVAARLRRRVGFSGAEWGVAVVSVILLVFMAILLGQGNSLVSRGQVALVALLPLLGVTIILGWIDRWAPLQARWKVLALVWGGGIAAGAAIIVNSALYQDVLLTSGDFNHATLVASVVVAPVAEETFKGIGVIVVLWWARHRLSSSLSGMALGALVGAGFAYIENIQYFLQALNEGTAVFGMTVFARSVMSPFIHPMATSLTGLGFASAMLRRPSWRGWAWRLAGGLLGAIAVHALWNGSASLGTAWILLYILVQIPLFSAWLAAIIVWSSRQPRQIAEGLRPYVETGWIMAAEVRMVTVPSARKYAKKWGKKIGRPAPMLVRRFLRRLGYLGLDQNLMTHHGTHEQRIEADREYLRDIQVIREEFRVLGMQEAS